MQLFAVSFCIKFSMFLSCINMNTLPHIYIYIYICILKLTCICIKNKVYNTLYFIVFIHFEIFTLYYTFNIDEFRF